MSETRSPGWLLAALPLLAALLGGCGKDQPPAAPPDAPAGTAAATTAPDLTGQRVYALHCMQCHEGQVIRAPHRTIIGLMAPHRVVAALESGAMQAQGSALTPAERRAVAEYVTGRPVTEPLPLAAAMLLFAAVSALAQDSSEEEAAVRAALQHYLLGHATGDGSHYEIVFHPEAKLFWTGRARSRPGRAQNT